MQSSPVGVACTCRPRSGHFPVLLPVYYSLMLAGLPWGHITWFVWWFMVIRGSYLLTRVGMDFSAKLDLPGEYWPTMVYGSEYWPTMVTTLIPILLEFVFRGSLRGIAPGCHRSGRHPFAEPEVGHSKWNSMQAMQERLRRASVALQPLEDAGRFGQGPTGGRSVHDDRRTITWQSILRGCNDSQSFRKQ